MKNILPDQSKIYIFIWYLKISILGTGESLIKISQAQVEVFALLQIWGFVDHQDYIVFTWKDSHEMATISQTWKWSEQVTN